MAKKTKPLLIMAVSCLMGGGLSFILFGDAGASTSIVEVPVAKVTMPPGYVIQAQDIEKKKMVVGDWYKAPEKIQGAIVHTGIPAGVPVSTDFLRHKAFQQETILFRIPINIYEMSSKLGKVDIYVLYKDGQSELLSEDAQVTAYYNRQNENISSGEARDRNPAAAEVIVKAADQQKVKNAQNKGNFYFIWKGEQS